MKGFGTRKNIVICIISLFMLFTFQTSILAQENTGNLMGFIYKEDGKKPLKNAQVIIIAVKDDTKIFKSNVTDKNGDYKIENVPAGEYKIQIRYKDKPYKIKRIDFYVKIFPGKTTFLSFSLKKKFPVAIIIIGTAATIAAATLIVHKKEKKVSPVER